MQSLIFPAIALGITFKIIQDYEGDEEIKIVKKKPKKGKPATLIIPVLDVENEIIKTPDVKEEPIEFNTVEEMKNI